MENKLLINKMKNAAELAWAAYGYYDLVANDTNPLFIKLKNEKENNEANSDENFTKKEINLADIMDSTFANYEVYKSQLSPKLKPEKVATLKGDFSPTQVKRFFEKYDLLDFYPKFDTKNNKQQESFHACLFQDKESKQYTLAIRGSFDSTDYTTDFVNLLKDSTIPLSFFKNL